MSGNVNVGTGGTFTSLTNTGGVFEYLNSAGATGNVQINITSDLTGETGSVALNELAGGFSVTIRPSGAARTISGTGTTAIIRLNDADGVTIDGSLTGGTAGNTVGGDASLRNLTIQNNSTSTSSAVVLIGSSTNGAQNNIVKNTSIIGNDPLTTIIGISIGGATPGSAGVDNDGNRVENCSLQKSVLGVYNAGASTTNPNTATVITKNEMAATTTNRLQRGAILIFNQDGAQVTLNNIGGINGAVGIDHYGIGAGIQDSTTTTVANGGITNTTISRNRINGVVSTSTVGFSAYGIGIAGGTTGANTIANNMITGVSSPSTSPDLVSGIFVASATGSNTKVYFNSIAMTGDRMVTGGSATQMPSFGIAYTADVALELKDNIFYTTQVSTGGGTNAKSYAIGTLATTFANLNSNYNDFWSTGANDGGFRSGSLAGGAGTDYATLAAWQAATSGDANSQEVDPLFVNDLNDLHLLPTTPVENDGIPVAGVTDDFDGNPRSMTTPEIGADELFVAQPGTLQFSSATYSVGEAGPTATLTVTRTGGTDGAVSVDYTLANGTATGGGTCGAGIDFVNTGGTVMFTNGEMSKSFTVAICDDAVFEGNEDFTSTLSNATNGATIGTPNPATVTITDNEVAMPGTVQFAQAFYSVGEGDGSVTLTVTRTGGSDGAISVGYGFLPLTANGAASCGAGIDFAAVSGTLNWANGDSASKTINVTICEDTDVEGNENFLSSLQSPTGGATIGTQSSTDVTIIDNDTASGPVTVTATAGTATATYNNLTEAVAAINNGTHQGDIVVSINQTITEPGTVVINGSGAGSASYTSVLIRPTADGISDSGASAQGRGLIELNGADNVTIDGDNPNSTGTNRNLTLQNTAANTVTFTSVIRVAVAATGTTSADNNSFRNLNILGSATGS